MHLSGCSFLKQQRGVSAIGLMVILAILALGASVAVPLLLNPPKLSREQLTLKRLKVLKEAIIGNPDIQPSRYRHSFGFVGDLGILPVSTDDLFTQGGYPTYTASPVNHVAYGWHGPYLDSRITADGYRVALLDAWGTPFAYNGDAISRTLVSAGPDKDYLTTADNLSLSIDEDEWRTPVSGYFLDPHRGRINETQLTIYHPDGTAALASTVVSPADPQFYNTATDPLVGERKIPIGLRSFYAQDIESVKLVTINGGPMMTADLIGKELAEDAVLFQNSFSDPGDLGPSSGTTPLRTIRGNWTVAGGSITSTWGHVAFGQMGWRDYRLEADITLNSNALGYGIYYRSDDSQTQTGYLFQFNPGLYGPFGGGLELVIRRIYLGNETYFPVDRRFLARVSYSSAQFTSLFGGQIWNDSHHVSITVSGDRHIIKLDGVPVIDTTDTEPIFPCGGRCGMAGFQIWNGSALFHHVRVTAIPPFPNEEKVWWSFEEGNGSRFYGSGFLIDGPEQNGTQINGTRLATGGVYGASIRLATTDPLQYLTVPDHNDLDLGSQGTISLWIYPETTNQRSGGLIHKGRLENLSDLAYSLEFQANDRLQLILIDASGTKHTLGSGKMFDSSDQNKWHHIVAVWDATGMAIYINGVLNDQNATTVTVRNTSGPLIIGAQFDTEAHKNWLNYPFKGRIDEVHLYHKRLTSAQVTLLFNQESGS